MTQFAAGRRKIASLVNLEHGLTRDDATREILRAEDAIKTNLAAQSEAEYSKAQRDKRLDRLLRSLKFPAMYQRLNQVSAAHGATYLRISDSFSVGTSSSDESPSVNEIRGSSAGSNEHMVSEHDQGSEPAVWHGFVGWLQSDGRLFWIQGKPGSGKSTLVKFLMEHTSTRPSSNDGSQAP